MTVNISNLLKIPGERIPVDFTADPGEIRDDIALPNGLRVTGELVNRAGIAEAELSLECEPELKCALCGKSFTRPYKTETRFVIAENEQSAENSDEDAFFPNESGELDLSEAVTELFILDLPFRFLCRDDCKGLCPVCGCDLNTEKCGCEVKAPSPFDVLKDYFGQQNR